MHLEMEQVNEKKDRMGAAIVPRSMLLLLLLVFLLLIFLRKRERFRTNARAFRLVHPLRLVTNFVVFSFAKARPYTRGCAVSKFTSGRKDSA